MITTDRNGPTTFYGNSTDTKPTGADAANGSFFLEMDTGKTYLYDASGDTWREWSGGGGGGGGNPNYVETITGTLENPWGNVTASDFAAALASNEVSATLQITVGTATALVNPVISGSYLIFSVAAYGSSGWSVIASAAYLVSNGRLLYAFYQQGGTLTDLKSMSESISTTLTIIHHPLPQGGD